METISNTVIKWADFPETVGSAKGHRTGEIFEVSFPSNYAEEQAIVRDFTFLLKFCLIGGALVFGMESDVLAATTLEEKAEALYYDKFIGIARWVIAGKGGFDTISKLLKEDFDGAKKAGFQYLLTFLVLMGLPKGLKFVEELFYE